MYFVDQIKKQIISSICLYNMDMWPGSHDFDATQAAERAAEAEAARPEQEELAEIADTSGETLAEMRTRIWEEQGRSERIARNASAEAIADTDNGGSWNPEWILAVAPASDGERLAAEAAVIAAGGDITDQAAINAAIISGRWENPGEMRELSEEEQTTVREWLLAWYAADVWIDAETLNTLYGFNTENNPDFNPETIGQDMSDFANRMERLRILTERTDGLEMPTNSEEFNALMERFTDENGQIHIPVTQEEMAEMWITVDADWNITLADGTTYSGTDVPPWRPYVSGWNVNSGYSWSARFEGGRSYGYESDIDVNNLPRWVEWLMDYIVHEEASGSYDTIYNRCRINPPRPVTQMTVWEVRQFQDRMVSEQNARGINPASSAIGWLQIIRWTLDSLVSAGVVSSWDTFNRETQHRLMVALLVEDGLDRYRSGQMWKPEFMRNIAGTWASFPADASWRWVHDGDPAWNMAYADPNIVNRLLDEIAQDAGWETPTA